MEDSLFRMLDKDFVIALDLVGNKYKRPLKNFKFLVSVFGVLKSGKKVLVIKKEGQKKFAFVGGNVIIGESILEALKRIFKEETGLKIEAGKLLGIQEEMITSKGEDAQCVVVFYEVKESAGKMAKNENLVFTDVKELTVKNFVDIHLSVLK